MGLGNLHGVTPTRSRAGRLGWGGLALCVFVGACGSGRGRRSKEHDAAPLGVGIRAAPRRVVDAGVALVRAVGHKRARREKGRVYAKAMQRGRHMAATRQYAAALAAFQKALVEVPNDARALSEIGWVAFKSGDLERAARATEGSLTIATAPQLRAASLYNRGRIAEARGEIAKALDAYRSSLELRPNAIVRARLEKLGGHAVAPFRARAMAGPFATIATACAQFPRYESSWTCGAPQVPGPTAIAAPPPPYLDIRVIGENPKGYDPGESFDGCRLALRLRAGWYTSDPISCEVYEWSKSRIEKLVIGPVARGGAHIIRWQHSYATGDRGYDRDGKRYSTWVSTRVELFCSVGANGQPRCMAPLRVSVSEKGDYAYSDIVPQELSVRLAAGGTLMVTAKSKAVAPGSRSLLGTHVLDF